MQFKGLSRVFSNTTAQRINSSALSFLYSPTLNPYMTTGKTIALTRWTLVGKVMPLLFNMLSRLVIASLPRSKDLLISWLQSPSAVILEPRKIKSDTVSTVSPSFPLSSVFPTEHYLCSKMVRALFITISLTLGQELTHWKRL